MPDFQRVILITLDGVGVGAMPDADQFGDVGAATLQHVRNACKSLHLPHLEGLGLLEIPGVGESKSSADIVGAYGRMAERSKAKDSTAGHWELAGLIQSDPLPTYPDGFPGEIIQKFATLTGVEPLGNVAASGTEIIQRLGEEHCRTGRPIVYTSVDSVFQIAAHEEVIPLADLYTMCRQARSLLDPYRVGRVIARPFIGTTANTFRRTTNRKDYSLSPTGPTLLDMLQRQDLDVIGVGKIGDLFAGRGLTRSYPTTSNQDGVAHIHTVLSEMQAGLIFCNLIDFDMLYGHRKDALGFGSALEEFDRLLVDLKKKLTPGDLLILAADHGCDPTSPGTDHTREYVPLLVWHPLMTHAINLGTRQSFADVAATVAENFCVEGLAGESFLKKLS